MSTILPLLSSTPVTFNALQKAAGLSATGLALALVDLGGKVAVQDGVAGAAEVIIRIATFQCKKYCTFKGQIFAKGQCLGFDNAIIDVVIGVF